MSDLRSRLLRLESRFTWDLKKEDLDLKDLSIVLQEQIDLGLGQRGAVAHSYSYLAYVRYLQDKPEEAMSLLSQSEEKTRECFGEESELRLIVMNGDLAWLSYQTGDFTQSDTYCLRVEDILVKYPTSSPTVLHPEVYGEKAWTFLKFSKLYYPKAKDCFLKALELQPDNSQWNAGYAIALYRTEPRDLETSLEAEELPVIKQLRRALEINPDDAVLLALLALNLSLYQKHEEAEPLAEKVLEIDPDNPQVTRYIAKYLRQQGQVDRSIDLLKRVLQRSSQSAFIHHQLAVCYRFKRNNLYSKKPNCKQEQQSSRAGSDPRTSQQHELEIQQWRDLMRQHLEETVRLKPSFVYAMADLALLYAEDKNMSRAEELFQKVLVALPEESASIRQFIHLCYGQFHQYHTTQEDLAITHYTKGLLLTQKTPDGKQCAKKLKQIAERRLSRDDNDGEAYGLLGLVAKEEGDRRTAVLCYEQALQCDPDKDQYLSALCELSMELQ
ncbi:interferon-induced protein with tetratricopeptide repeats 5-like [Centroberyx affinis]|uniref:interferon-induced protein with tetratricopeptide repeats 5-like n=1 Tax=Centroberyx affinis TaxID=166261 RepID=UPI003A5B993C